MICSTGLAISKQRARTDCGPASIGNLCAWVGYGSYSKHGPHIKSLLNFHPGQGTLIKNVPKTLIILSKKIPFTFKKMRNASWTKMKEAMDNGFGLLCSYDFNVPCKNGWIGGHMVFVFKDEFGYLSVNDVYTDSYDSPADHLYIPYQRWQGRIARGGFECWQIERADSP